tara:strand:+ start:981 stop:1841 length:861 start_codon:yes stop_codon:yes gene_type:complete
MNLKYLFRYKFKKKRNRIHILNANDLSKLKKELSKVRFFGLDTEFDWRSTYYPRISIIQIVTDKSLFLIDCLKVNPISALQEFLEDPNFLKIFHSVRSDTTVLSNCLSIKTKNVFDIQQADKILSGGEIRSYGKIVKNFFGVKLKKNETNSNWLKRPLSESQEKYAFEDVDFLIEIYKLQRKQLNKLNIFDEVKKNSDQEANLGNQSLKQMRFLRQEKKLSKRKIEIFIWREDVAEEDNVPPNFIFKDKYLKQLSKIDTKNIHARKEIMTIFGDSELTDRFISRFK